ncbi:nuclease-related domain-containing protein [Streptomyces sp. NPDC021100]|uniref:nuclease-related domain-containing protein n=1 Tax=Streptomyces sp. NPDC021100 TaxID=3365114 RepID=UPI0037A47EE5
MSDLTVNPWKRHGRDRLYVNLPDGTAVAWADRGTKAVTIKVQKYRVEALVLLRQHLGDSVTVNQAAETDVEPSGANPGAERPQSDAPSGSLPNRMPKLPKMTVADDLARNPPGAGLLEALAVRGPSPIQRFWSKVSGRTSEWDAFYVGLAGEQRAGRELERLGVHGWRVLHGVPNGRGGDIDHLLMGPGGVFSINTKRHPGAIVWVGDKVVKINGGPPQPYVAASESEAMRVQSVLQRYCGFAVPVEPMIVFVDIESLVRSATRYAVHIYQEREVSALGPLSGRLAPAQVEQVFEVARHRRVWLRS